MTIEPVDIKKLWGLAAGRCSKPGCDRNCVPYLDEKEPTVVGEMAHIIDKEPNGKRSGKEGGSDSYDNLILLCPTHHTEVDKAPAGTFPIDVLHKWKQEHEHRIQEHLKTVSYLTKNDLFVAIGKLLIINKKTWETYGPASRIAQQNPLSNASKIWAFRKMAEIVPNNRQIINLIQGHQSFFSPNEFGIAAGFIEHAEGFEKNCYSRVEGIPTFPIEFERMINAYAGI